MGLSQHFSNWGLYVPRIFIFLIEASLNTLLKSSNKLAVKLDCKSTYSFNDLSCL